MPKSANILLDLVNPDNLIPWSLALGAVVLGCFVLGGGGCHMHVLELRASTFAQSAKALICKVLTPTAQEPTTQDN